MVTSPCSVGLARPSRAAQLIAGRFHPSAPWSLPRAKDGPAPAGHDGVGGTRSCPIIGFRRGSGKRRASWSGDGRSTREARPSRRMRSTASGQDGISELSLVQWTTLASSHQSTSRGITFWWAPELRKSRIAFSVSHAVSVQKVRLLSTSRRPPRKPEARTTCRCD